MKNNKYLILFTFLQISATVFSQDTLDEKTFRKLLNRQFTQVINGQSNHTIGNFAAVDIKETKLTLNGATITQNGNVFSLTANAGIAEGVSALFNNSKLNSNVGLQFRFSMLNPYSKKINFTRSSTIKRDDAVNQIKADQQLKKELLNKRLIFIDKSIIYLDYEINRLKEELKTITTKEPILFQLAQLEYKKDSLETIKKIDFSNLQNVFKKIDSEAKIAEDIAKLDLVDVIGFSFGWFNLAYGVKSQSFRLFDPTQIFSEQIKKDNYTTHTVNFQFSYYNWSIHPGKSFFLQLGANGSIANNLNMLTTIELSDKTEWTVNAEQRTTIQKYNVYTGEYSKDLKAAQFYADYYHFFLNNNSIALHAYPKMFIQEKQAPFYDCGIGLFMSLKDSKDAKDKSLVNVEVFVNFKDLTNTNDSSKDLLERNEIGFRLAFPIKFYNKN